VKVTPDAPAERFVRDPKIFADAASEPARHLLMGDIAAVSGEEVELSVDVVGSAPIERLDIFDGPELVETVRPYDEADLGPRLRLVYEGAEYRGRARTTVWDGSLKVTGNAIRAASVFNNWNLDRGIAEATSSRVSWRAVTTGNFGGLDLLLAEKSAGRLAIDTRHLKADVAVADIGLTDAVFEAGGLGRRLRLYRLPERLARAALTHRRRVRLSETGDTRLFVRVTQEDGHRAWSSPIYLFRRPPRGSP
jgi:hypothetical protein